LISHTKSFSRNGLTPNGQNHDLNNDIPWYDNVSQMEPMEFYEEHPRDGIDVAKAAIIFDHNMQTKGNIVCFEFSHYHPPKVQNFYYS